MGISSYGLSSQYLQKNETTQMNTEKALASGSLDLVHTVNYTLAEKRSQRLTDSRTWFSVTYTLTTQKTMDHKKKTNFCFPWELPIPPMAPWVPILTASCKNSQSRGGRPMLWVNTWIWWEKSGAVVMELQALVMEGTPRDHPSHFWPSESIEIHGFKKPPYLAA